MAYSDDHTGYQLHPQLALDTSHVCNLALCEVRLMNDQRYPWLVLVPTRPDIVEVYELSDHEQRMLWEECTQTGQRLMAKLGGDKLNIATLGNVVPQLHVHVIVRFASDDAWPAPVWGQHPAKPFAAELLAERIEDYRPLLQAE